MTPAAGDRSRPVNPDDPDALPPVSPDHEPDETTRQAAGSVGGDLAGAAEVVVEVIAAGAEVAGTVAEGAAEAVGAVASGAAEGLGAAAGGLADGCGGCSLALLVMLFTAAGTAYAAFG